MNEPCTGTMKNTNKEQLKSKGRGGWKWTDMQRKGWYNVGI